MVIEPRPVATSPNFRGQNLNWKVAENVEQIDSAFLALLHLQHINKEELLVIEKFTGGVKTRFVCVFAYHNPILIFPIQEIFLRKANFPAFKRTLWQRLVSTIVDFSRINLLFSGSLLRIDKNYLGYDADSISENQAFELHLEIIGNLRKDRSYSAQLLTLPSAIAKYLDKHLLRLGFKQPLPDYVMQMNLRNHWTNWDTYLADLSKKYVVRARKIREAFAPIQTRFLSNVELETLETDMQLLYLQTVGRQEILLTKVVFGYFSALKELYGNTFQVKGFFKDGKLLAFYSWFNHKDYLEMHFIGLDYIHNHAYQLYFNILFEGLLDGIGQRKQSVSYGRTTLDAKASLGAVAVPSSSFLQLGVQNNFITETLRSYVSRIENPVWKSRHPLKSLI